MTNARWVPRLAQKKKGSEGYSKTVHPEKAFATKPDDLSLTAEIHMAARELCQLPSDLVDLRMGCVCPHTHTQAKYLKVAEQQSLIPISVLPRPKNRTPKGPAVELRPWNYLHPVENHPAPSRAGPSLA